MKWIKAAVGKQVKLIAVDDVVYFQSDTKYTRVVLAQRRGADPHAAEGPAGRARPGEVLADPSRHDRQPRRGRGRAARGRERQFVLLKGRQERLPISRQFVHLFKQM